MRFQHALVLFSIVAAGCSQHATIPQQPLQSRSFQSVSLAQPPAADLGSYPEAPPIMVGNVLYGTTSTRSKHGGGAVYGLTAKGNGFLLHAFRSLSDDQTILTSFNGILYGAIANGGEHGYGGVFGVDASTGKQTLFYSFKGGADAQIPGNLIHLGGLLYGTSLKGGQDFGTIFSVDPLTGKERIAYNFLGFTRQSGAYPQPSIINIRSIIYGMTQQGGEECCGEVFKFDPATRTEKTLFEMENVDRGKNVVTMGGQLYFEYESAIFQMDPKSGAYEPICGAPPGNISQLLVANGVLYAVTQRGGSYGYGTLFKFNLKQQTYYAVHEFSPELEISQHQITYAHGAFYGIGLGAPDDFVVQFGKGYEKRLYAFPP